METTTPARAFEARSIGRHRVAVGDVTRGDVDRLMGHEEADVIYVDPPWGPGALQMFATMDRPGAAPAKDWPGFLKEFCVALAVHRRRSARTPVFVEMGLRWADEVAAAMDAHLMPVRAQWECKYKSGLKLIPQALLYSGPELPTGFDPTEVYGPRLPFHCLEAAMDTVLWGIAGKEREKAVGDGLIVLDTCCGLGLTARAASDLGLDFRGLELNPRRLTKTIEALKKAEARADKAIRRR